MKKIEKKSKLHFERFEVVKLYNPISVIGGTNNNGGPATNGNPPQMPSGPYRINTKSCGEILK